MTDDDLRTRAEAASLIWAPRHHIFESSNANAHYRAGFMDGVKWHADQQPARDIDVDELAQVIERASDTWWNDLSDDGPSVGEYGAAAVKAWLDRRRER